MTSSTWKHSDPRLWLLCLLPASKFEGTSVLKGTWDVIQGCYWRPCPIWWGRSNAGNSPERLCRNHWVSASAGTCIFIVLPSLQRWSSLRTWLRRYRWRRLCEGEFHRFGRGWLWQAFGSRSWEEGWGRCRRMMRRVYETSIKVLYLCQLEQTLL